MRHYSRLQTINRRDLKLLASLKLKVDAALAGHRLGHTNGWVAVQKQIDRIDDVVDCESLARGAS